MSLAASGSRGSAITLGSQALLLLLRLVSIVVLARLLAPEVFGLVAIAGAIVTFVTAIIFLGLPMATASADSLSHRAGSSLWLVNATLGAVVGALLFACAQPIAQIYDDVSLVPIVAWLAAVPVMSGLGTQFRQKMVRDLKFGRIALVELSAQTTGLCAAIVLALAGASYGAIVAQLVVAAGTQMILNVALAGWFPGIPGAWRAEVVPLLKTGSHVFGINLLQQGTRSVTIPALALVAPPTAVGQFDRAQQLTVMPVSLTVEQLQRVVVPVLSRLRGDHVQMLRYMQRFQLLNAYVTSTGFMLLAVLGVPLIEVILGEDWAFAGVLVQIFSVGAVFRASGQAMQWLFISAQQTQAGLKFGLWAQPLVAVISLCGLPGGATGVALSGTIAWVLYWPAAAIFASRACGYHAWELMVGVARGTFGFAVPVAMGAAMAYVFDLSAFATVVVGLGLGLVVALALVWGSRAVREDLRALARALRRSLPGKRSG